MVSGTVYNGDDSLTELMAKVISLLAVSIIYFILLST